LVSRDTTGAVKVVLLSLDDDLQLRQLLAIVLVGITIFVLPLRFLSDLYLISLAVDLMDCNILECYEPDVIEQDHFIHR
jgi:hypothetical protein